MTTPRGRRLVAVAGPTLALLLAACGGPVDVEVPELDAADARACAAFAADLPPTLAEQAAVAFEPSTAPAGAYGDPAIVVRCGVGVPEGFDLTSSCEIADGVGYYIPDEQYRDQALDVTVTTAGYTPRVEVLVPAEYRPNAVAAVMTALAPVVTEHLTLVDACD